MLCIEAERPLTLHGPFRCAGHEHAKSGLPIRRCVLAHIALVEASCKQSTSPKPSSYARLRPWVPPHRGREKEKKDRKSQIGNAGSQVRFEHAALSEQTSKQLIRLSLWLWLTPRPFGYLHPPFASPTPRTPTTTTTTHLTSESACSPRN